jgi:hypothetical protein
VIFHSRQISARGRILARIFAAINNDQITPDLR